MGGCGLHATTCNSGAGTTLDITPRNIELCIDGRPISRLPECDPGATASINRVPVYSPVTGCATYDSAAFTLIINFDNVGCSRASQPNDRVVTLTHLIPSGSFPTTSVNAGQLVGYLCRDSEKSTCGIDGSPSSGVPTHLAFKLRYQDPNLSLANLTFHTEVVGFLAKPNCNHDDWVFSQGANPVRYYGNSWYARCP
jgi:hypothetical protein